MPGFMNGERSTALLRASLASAGFAVHGWGEGINFGARTDAMVRLGQKVEALGRASGGELILIGWSLGGLFARVLAQQHPEACRLVVTLGSPFSGDRRANNASRLYEAINDHKVDNPPLTGDPKVKPLARTIAVWSVRDGIVAPACAMGEAVQSDLRIEVPFKHFELVASRGAVVSVLRILRENLDWLRSTCNCWNTPSRSAICQWPLTRSSLPKP